MAAKKKVVKKVAKKKVVKKKKTAATRRPKVTKKATPKKAPKKEAKTKKRWRGRNGNPRVHRDMITIAMKGPEAEELMQYLEKHNMTGVQLLREGYRLYREARKGQK